MSLDPNIDYDFEHLRDYPDQEAVIEYILATEPEWSREEAIKYMMPLEWEDEIDIFTDVNPPPDWEELKRTTNYA